jgi:hypothetical protein
MHGLNLYIVAIVLMAAAYLGTLACMHFRRARQSTLRVTTVAMRQTSPIRWIATLSDGRKIPFIVTDPAGAYFNAPEPSR